jgi:glycosyltransferase involved in cell wall biosynthesis
VLGSRRFFGEAEWLNDSRVELAETTAPIYSLQEQGPDMHNLYRGSTLLWVPHYNAPLWYRGRMVVTIHDLAPLAVPEALSNGIKRAYARLLLQRSTRQARAVLCVSEFTRRELRERLDVPEEKIAVTSLGIDMNWPESAEGHREDDGVPYLLYVGNIKPNKNLGFLVQAFAQVMHRMPHRLLLVGKMKGFGSGDEAVIRQAQALGDRVRFMGAVEERELMRLYAGAEAMVLPSRYEGFGLPMLEAMHLGCPVLAARAGSLPEVGGDAALYFGLEQVDELAEQLLRVQDRATMESLRQRGSERVREFSFARCAEQTAVVLNRCMERA